MLRRCHNREEEGTVQRVQALEGFGSELFGLLLGRALRCIVEDPDGEVTLERHWVRLRSAGGSEFAIAIDDEEPTDAYRILRWGAHLQSRYSAVFSGACPRIQPPGVMNQWTECEVLLKADDGWEASGAIAAPNPVLETIWDVPLVDPAPRISSSDVVRRSYSLTLALRGSMTDEGRGYCASPLLYVSVAERAFLARMSASDTGAIFFDMLQEDPMSETLHAPVTLDLGEIELTAEQLLSLRPGMKLTFERPAQFEATLRIAGTPWAVSDLTLEDGSVQLTITELCDGAPQREEAGLVEGALQGSTAASGA